jgi:hypothetical protein
LRGLTDAVVKYQRQGEVLCSWLQSAQYPHSLTDSSLTYGGTKSDIHRYFMGLKVGHAFLQFGVDAAKAVTILKTACINGG